MNKSELLREYLNAKIVENKPITKQEYDALPENARYSSDGYYYRPIKFELTPEEINSAIALKTLNSVNTIKKICVFFLVLTIISVIITLFGYFKLADFISGFSSSLY